MLRHTENLDSGTESGCYFLNNYRASLWQHMTRGMVQVARTNIFTLQWKLEVKV